MVGEGVQSRLCDVSKRFGGEGSRRKVDVAFDGRDEQNSYIEEPRQNVDREGPVEQRFHSWTQRFRIE